MDDHTGQRHQITMCSPRASAVGWRIASILPYRDVFRLSHELSIEMLVIVIAVALAAYLLAYLTSQSTLKRISQLTGHDAGCGKRQRHRAAGAVGQR